MRRLSAFGMTCLAALSLSAPAATARAGDWLHFGYDGGYTSHNPLEATVSAANVATLQRRWGLGCDDQYYGEISGSPAVYGGKLFTAGSNAGLSAYDALNGMLLWQFDGGSSGWAPQPTVSQDGTVFYLEGSHPTSLYAIRADTGAKLWEAPIGFEIGFSDTTLVTVDETLGRVYVVEKPFFRDAGRLFALDKNTGNVVWYKSKELSDQSFRGDYVLLGGGKIFAAGLRPISEYFEAEHMLKIDAASQAIETVYERPVQTSDFYEVARYTLCGDKLAVVYSDRDDYFASKSILTVYDVTSPNILWQKQYPESSITGEVACNASTNTLYVPTNPYLFALNATDGSEVWTFLGYGKIFSPSTANGVVYFISDTNMYAVSASTGQELLSYPLGATGHETTQVAISNGLLYFSGNMGTCDLFALSMPGPPPLPVVTIGAPDPIAAESRRNAGVFRLTRTGSAANPLVVHYGVSGSARNGIDYRALSGRVAFQAGSSIATITVRPINDRIPERVEKVRVTLSSRDTYQRGAVVSAVVKIKDND